MDIIEAIILGLVQGFTEFLPVSSSGHLVLFQQVFGLSEDSVAFDVLLHVASLLAVLICMRSEVVSLVKKPLSPPVIKLAVATVPTVIIVLLLGDFIESAFDGSYLGLGFLLTAAWLTVAELAYRSRPVVCLRRDISYAGALAMGLAQGIATLPGISRSGSTIATGMACGENKDNAAKFSFLMSIPIIIASAALKLPELSSGSIEFLPLLCGFVAAFASAMLSIKIMLRLIKRRGFMGFVAYLTALGVLVLLNQHYLFWF